jgi:drug/metabolite transporter (DMT)-like permease
MSFRHIGLLLLLAAIWGASFLFIKIGVSEMGPFTFAMLRVLIGSVVLLAIILVNKQGLPRDRRTWWLFAFMGVFNALIPFGLIAWGEQSIPSGLAAILNATMPLFTFILAAIFDHERVTVGRILGMVIGFGGILIITLPQLASGFVASVWGELAVIVAAASYALATVFARRNLHHVKPITASFGQIAMGCLFLIPFAMSEHPWTIHPSLIAIIALLVLSIVGTALAYLIYYRLLQEGGATLASLVTFITPLFGVFYGFLFLSETMSWTSLVALVCILGSVLLIRSKQNAAPITGDTSSAGADSHS